MEELHVTPRGRVHARCLVFGHKWVRVGGADGVTKILRCRRCWKVRDDRGGVNVPDRIGM